MPDEHVGNILCIRTLNGEGQGDRMKKGHFFGPNGQVSKASDTHVAESLRDAKSEAEVPVMPGCAPIDGEKDMKPTETGGSLSTTIIEDME
jgi:hypothetical protein